MIRFLDQVVCEKNIIVTKWVDDTCISNADTVWTPCFPVWRLMEIIRVLGIGSRHAYSPVTKCKYAIVLSSGQLFALHHGINWVVLVCEVTERFRKQACWTPKTPYLIFWKQNKWINKNNDERWKFSLNIIIRPTVPVVEFSRFHVRIASHQQGFFACFSLWTQANSTRKIKVCAYNW